MVDDEDYEYLMQWKWKARKNKKKVNGKVLIANTYYVSRAFRIGDRKLEKKKQILMHREIMKVLDCPKVEVDHKDHNGLNNQKSNLRICNSSQNRGNVFPMDNCSSKYKGVSINFNKKTGTKKWVAILRGKTLARFEYNEEGEILAAQTYDEAAEKHFGEFAYLNFK